MTGRVVKMDFIVNNIVNVDTHPFEPFIKNDTKYLIVGTIPPHRFCINSLEDGDVKWFYGSKDNSFWEIISSVFDVELNDLDSIEKRKEFSTKNYIGFIDLFHQIYRYKESSSDSDIIPISFKDIFKYIENTEIDTILFTSEYVEKLSKSLLSDKKNYVNRDSKKDITKFDYINFNNNNIKWIKLKSPSFQQRTSIEDKKKEWKEIFNKLQMRE